MNAEYRLKVNQGDFEVHLLDELQPVDVEHLYNLLRRHHGNGLSPAEQQNVAKAIHRACALEVQGGALAGYEGSIAKLKRGSEIGWPELLRELPPEPVAEAEPDF